MTDMTTVRRVVLSDRVIEAMARRLAAEFGMEAEFGGHVTDTPYTPDYWRNLARDAMTVALTGKD